MTYDKYLKQLFIAESQHIPDLYSSISLRHISERRRQHVYEITIQELLVGFHLVGSSDFRSDLSYSEWLT
jgi:hypothetical protein